MVDMFVFDVVLAVHVVVVVVVIGLDVVIVVAVVVVIAVIIIIVGHRNLPYSLVELGLAQLELAGVNILRNS